MAGLRESDLRPLGKHVFGFLEGDEEEEGGAGQATHQDETEGGAKKGT
jgi:hypothetical protein